MGNANTWSQSHKVTEADSPVQRQCRKYPPTTRTANATTAVEATTTTDFFVPTLPKASLESHAATHTFGRHNPTLWTPPRRVLG